MTQLESSKARLLQVLYTPCFNVLALFQLLKYKLKAMFSYIGS